MENKFKFLVKHSLSKKISNRWFLGVNIILAVVIIALINVDSIVNFLGGDFEEKINIKIYFIVGFLKIKTC
jgi:hypothetical protein